MIIDRAGAMLSRG